MPYRVYLSTSDANYRKSIKTALLNLTSLAMPITPEDVLPMAGESPLEVAQRLIANSELFVGVYDGNYGAALPNRNMSSDEFEYQFAHEHGLQCLIFLPVAALSSADERFRAFRLHLAERHVLYTFNSLAELQAQIVLALNTYKQTQKLKRGPLIAETVAGGGEATPPERTSASAAPRAESSSRGDTPDDVIIAAAPLVPAPPPTDLEAVINQALSIADDDLEAIVRRALTLHDAQKNRPTSPPPSAGMLVNPIFGAPLMSAQFQADLFMITPFRPHFDQVYQNIIRPVVSNLNLTIKRGDDFASLSGSIINEVWAAIHACRVVIVETTEVNANVYYELGIAHTLGKPAILLTQEKDLLKIPFDIRHLRFIMYEDSIAGGEKLEEDLRRSLVWILNDLAANGA